MRKTIEKHFYNQISFQFSVLEKLPLTAKSPGNKFGYKTGHDAAKNGQQLPLVQQFKAVVACGFLERIKNKKMKQWVKNKKAEREAGR